MSERIPVAVLGATGSVGQRFLTLLADHPWFDPVVLTASDRSAGRLYAEAAPWMQARPLDARLAGLTLAPTEPAAVAGCPLVFSALDAGVAGPVEAALAAAGHLVVTNAGSHRMDADVPLLVPEVNAGHLDAVRERAQGGAILANPNCSTIGLALALAPLATAFGLAKVHAVTMQALSGAGLPGVPSMAILDNLIPYIANEEEKIERELRKILGGVDPETGGFVEHPVVVSAQCNRVAVLDGHTACVSVTLDRPATEADLVAAWEAFAGEPQRLGLPSAPRRPVHVLDRPDGPQPRLHRDLDGGMAAVVGRLRRCPLADFKFVVLSHNTIRGAAGGALLVAELAVARGMVHGYGRGRGD